MLSADSEEYAVDLELPARKVRGWVHEVEVPMRVNDTIHYSSAHEPSTARVEFNVHSHHGKEVRYYAQTEVSTAGTFSAPHEGKFYLMWENISESPVRVRVRVRRQGRA